MNNKRYFQLIFLLVAFLASLLVACSSTAPTEMPDTDVVTANELPAEEIAEISVEAPGEPQPDANPDPSQEGNGNTPGDPGQLSVVPAVSRMVIKDAEMELLVADTDLSMPEVVQLAGDYEGYIITSKTWFEDEYKYASIQLGIPVDHFETVLNRLRSLGLQVVRETASGQDVTGEYVDLQSRLTNLEATADRVRGFLADANSIDESLQISAQLAELEAQIEQVKGQMYYYEGRSAFSTVTVFLTPLRPTPIPVATPTPAPTPTLIPPWSAADVFDESAETLKENSTKIADKWIRFLVIQGPFVLFGGVMLLGVWIAVRKVRS